MPNGNVINVESGNQTFFENLPDMEVNRSVTDRLINWIQEASLGLGLMLKINR